MFKTKRANGKDMPTHLTESMRYSQTNMQNTKIFQKNRIICKIKTRKQVEYAHRFKTNGECACVIQPNKHAKY